MNGEKRVIDASTLIPLGHLLVLIGILVGGAMWVTRVDIRLASIEHTLEKFMDAHELRTWVEVLEAKNPSLDVPELDHRQ